MLIRCSIQPVYLLTSGNEHEVAYRSWENSTSLVLLKSYSKSGGQSLLSILGICSEIMVGSPLGGAKYLLKANKLDR
jgi:hypothetical protein